MFQCPLKIVWYLSCHLQEEATWCWASGVGHYQHLAGVFPDQAHRSTQLLGLLTKPAVVPAQTGSLRGRRMGAGRSLRVAVTGTAVHLMSWSFRVEQAFLSGGVRITLRTSRDKTPWSKGGDHVIEPGSFIGDIPGVELGLHLSEP